MGALLSLPTELLNFLLPFTNKNTPLVQDLIHTAVLCGTLYYGPQLADLYHSYQQPKHAPHAQDTQNDDQQHEPHTDLPQPDDADGLPPLAPTPPSDPEHQHQQHHRHQEQQQEQNRIPNAEPTLLAANDPAAQAFLAQHHHHNHHPEHANDNANDADADDNNAAAPGPANRAHHPPPTRANRTIGAKKAKSLARKDQRRAYHEFHRAQAEQRRQADAHGREEREAALAAARDRRAAVEARIKEDERAAREEAKVAARAAEDEERGRRARVLDCVRRGLAAGGPGMVDLSEVAVREGGDAEWVERLVRASGMMGAIEREVPGARVMVTGTGWAVRLDADVMGEAYARAVEWGNQHGGRVGMGEMGGFVESALRERAQKAF